MYVDAKAGASVLIEEDLTSKSYTITGVLRPGVVITPKKGSVALNPADCAACLRLTPHQVVHHPSNESDSADYQQVEADYSRARLARSGLGKVHPEILVVVDFALFKKLNFDPGAAQKYVLAFFNAVNLRFSSISQPKIELNVAGIVVGLEDSSLPFLKDNLVSEDVLDAPRALHAMGRYYFKER